MAHPYSPSRPLVGSEPETETFKDLEDYAHKIEVQSLLHRMLTDLIINKPDQPLEYMVEWLSDEVKRKQLEQI